MNEEKELLKYIARQNPDVTVHDKFEELKPVVPKFVADWYKENYGGQRMNVTLEDYLENHTFCDYENTEASIRLKVKDSIYFLDQDTFDYFCNDYVKDVEVSIDGNEYGVWLLVVIELNRYE